MQAFRFKSRGKARFAIARVCLLVFLLVAMAVIKLSTLSIWMGLGVAIINLYGVINPSEFGVAARKFPRSLPLGYALTLAATAWFMWNVSHESLADFEKLKPILFTLFIGVGLGTCYFVQDFLAVRGVSALLLLLAKVMVDSEHWANSDWRLVIAVWAYVLIVAGMWFTVSPWRLRDILYWATANEKRIRIGSAMRAAFGIFVFVLGLTAFQSG
jgi:hypothetical protein